jgi:hypothetical protein
LPRTTGLEQESFADFFLDEGRRLVSECEAQLREKAGVPHCVFKHSD